MTGINEIPPYHVCHALSAENESIRGKYDKLKRKYKDLYKEILELKEKLIRIEIESEYNNLRQDVRGNQTKLKRTKTKKIEQPTVEVEVESTAQKLIPLYDSLMKRFEMESKLTRNQAKKISKLEAEKEKLQEENFKGRQECDFMKKQMEDKDVLLRNVSSVNKTSRSSKQDLENRITSLIKEKNLLMKDNEKLRGELKGLDESFFEELEDMKYALQQSTKLNQEYERALKQVCKQTGHNYKQTLQKQQTKHSTPNSTTTTTTKKTTRRKSRQSNGSL